MCPIMSLIINKSPSDGDNLHPLSLEEDEEFCELTSLLSFNIITFFLGYSNAMCTKPKHLKYFVLLVFSQKNGFR